MTNPLAGYLTPSEAAKMLGVSTARLRVLCTQGRITRVMLNNRMALIDKASAERVAQELTEKKRPRA